MEDLSLIFPYTATQLTEQVDVIPPLYGLLAELDLFPSEGSISRIVEMRYEYHQLRVLPAKERGAPATPALPRTGKTIFVEVPHFPALDLITPEDIQDILIQMQDQKRLTTVAEETAKRLMDIKASHDVTREWLRCQMLQGNLIDGNSQNILSMASVFGISLAQVDFALGTTTGGANGNGTDMNAKCQAVWQSITANLRGEVMRGVEAIVDPTFFQRFISHPNVQSYYLNAEQAIQLAMLVRRERDGNMWGREFRFGSILWREYYGAAPVKTSPTATSLTSTPFWSANTGSAYPIGTRKMFRTYNAPAHDLRFVNTKGNEIYVSPRILPHGEGIELKSESNPLPICRRPEALVQIISSN
jgi:hypothetical protein